VVLVIVGCAIAIGPPALGLPPDPTIMNASPRPDWYFLWYFALLTLIPHWSENWVIVLGPLLFGLFLIVLPFVAPRGERSPLRRPWSIAIVVFAIVVVAHYSHQGYLAPWAPRLEAQPLPSEVVGSTTGTVADGAKVFYDKGCEFCHMVSGLGGIRGPDLSFVGDRLNRDQIATRIFSGAANMPSYAGKLTDTQLNDLLSFLESRRRLPPVGPPPAGFRPLQGGEGR
jgi:ubiquinol-cytochrome c reductase cytochrome b subunit